jgi:hypothetical protein
MKPKSEIVSIEAGMQIDRSDEHDPNAHFPRIESSDPCSNVKYERVSQKLKHSAEIISIDEGIQRHRRENASEQK